MKKQLTLTIAMSLFAATVHAGPAAPRVTPEALKQNITKYETEMREHILGKGRTNANGLASQASKIAEEKLISQLDLSSAEKANLKSALTGADAKVVEARLDNLISIVSARRLATSLEKTDSAEAASITKSTEALSKTIANSIFTRSKADSSRLSKQELADAGLALDRLEKLPEAVVKMEKSERDSYTAVELKRDELLLSGKFSGEEALVEAIMQVKNVGKEEAMNIVRKLKDCV